MCFVLVASFSVARAEPPQVLFDLEAIRDVPSLETTVLQDWKPAANDPSVHQKLIEITVCHWWPGQPIRLPLTLNVPADRLPCRHVVVANQGLRPTAAMPSAEQLELLKEHGVGVVLIGMGTIDAMQPEGELHHGMRQQLLQTKDLRYTAAWIWGMSQMRALTAAMTEPKYFAPEKVLATGGSKRGVATAVAGIVDDRFTAILPVVTPILGNPGGTTYVMGTEPAELLRIDEAFIAKLKAGELGIQPEAAEALVERDVRRSDTRITLAQAKAANWSEQEMESITDQVWDAARMTKHLPNLKDRSLEMLYVVGTNDSVSPKLLELGKMIPDFPVCIIPGGQHGGPANAGFTRQVPKLQATLDNFTSFARHHFFGDRSLPRVPAIASDWSPSDRKLSVSVTFNDGTEPEVNKLWWNINRSKPYTLPFEYDHWESIPLMKTAVGVYQAEVEFAEIPKRIDVVSLHTHSENDLPLTFSSPYHRVRVKL